MFNQPFCCCYAGGVAGINSYQRDIKHGIAVSLLLGQSAPKEESEDDLANCCLPKTAFVCLATQMELASNRTFALKCLWKLIF